MCEREGERERERERDSVCVRQKVNQAKSTKTQVIKRFSNSANNLVIAHLI